MNIKDLKPAPYNPRKITDKQLSMLRKSMAEFGDLSGIVVNVKTGNVVGGHQRIKNLDPSWKIEKESHFDKVGTIALGYIETPWGRWQYREVNWPEKKEAAANVAANKHGGEFDLPKLKDIMIDLDTGDFDMELTGFNTHELEMMMTAVYQDTKQSIMSKNFNNGRGEYDLNQKDSGDDQDKYPITFVLSKEEWESWEILKNKFKLKDDKAAFLKIIGAKTNA